MRGVMAVAGGYLLAALMMTWPLAANLGTRLPAPDGRIEAERRFRGLDRAVRAWAETPWDTLVGRASPTGAPDDRPSDSQLAQALVAMPFVLSTGSLALASNLILIASIAASGAAMHVLALAVTGSTAGAWLAGLAWACWPWRTAHLGAPELQALYFMPLALWALARVAAGRRWRDAALTGTCTAVQAAVSWTFGVLTAFALILAAPALGWATGQWRARRYWSRVAIGGGVPALLAVLLAAPSSGRAAQGSADVGTARAATIRDYGRVPPLNLLYGRRAVPAQRMMEPTGSTGDADHRLFPGVVLVALAVWGFWSGRRSDLRAMTTTATTLVVGGVWSSLDPRGLLGFNTGMVTGLAGVDAIDAPARAAAVAMLGAAVLAAVGVARLPEGRFRHRRALLAVVFAALLAEYANVPIPLIEAPARDVSGLTAVRPAWLGPPGLKRVDYRP